MVNFDEEESGHGRRATRERRRSRFVVGNRFRSDKTSVFHRQFRFRLGTGHRYPSDTYPLVKNTQHKIDTSNNIYTYREESVIYDKSSRIILSETNLRYLYKHRTKNIFYTLLLLLIVRGYGLNQRFST